MKNTNFIVNEVYEKFIKLCQQKNDLIVSAGNTCPNRNCPDCMAYYLLNDNQSHIWVNREITQDVFVFKNSDSVAVNRFLESSLKPIQELVLLSHEYGHYISLHDGIIKRDYMEDCQREFETEREAWISGERVLDDIGFVEWAHFEYWKKQSLDGYYDGFKTLFSNFTPLFTYER